VVIGNGNGDFRVDSAENDVSPVASVSADGDHAVTGDADTYCAVSTPAGLAAWKPMSGSIMLVAQNSWVQRTWGEYEITARARIGSNGVVGLVGLYASRDNFFYATYNRQQACAVLYRVQDGEHSAVAGSAVHEVPVNGMASLSLLAVDGVVTFRIDGATMGSYEIPAAGATLDMHRGSAGIFAWNVNSGNMGAAFRDI